MATNFALCVACWLLVVACRLLIVRCLFACWGTAVGASLGGWRGTAVGASWGTAVGASLGDGGCWGTAVGASLGDKCSHQFNCYTTIWAHGDNFTSKQKKVISKRQHHPKT